MTELLLAFGLGWMLGTLASIAIVRFSVEEERLRAARPENVETSSD